ncbi:MAG TPA: hypothetical protein VGF40_00370 [Thermoanaerobaculia bacterium]
MPDRSPDFDSTLVRAGSEASTLGEITAFTQMIEERPLAQLLDDLAALEFLSETKFRIARRTLRRRVKAMSEGERALVQTRLRVLDRTDPAVAERLRDLLGPLE